MTEPSYSINIALTVSLWGEANIILQLFQRIHAHTQSQGQVKPKSAAEGASGVPTVSISGPSIYCLRHWYAKASGFLLLRLLYSKELNLSGKIWGFTQSWGVWSTPVISHSVKEVRLLQQHTSPHIKQAELQSCCWSLCNRSCFIRTIQIIAAEGPC